MNENVVLYYITKREDARKGSGTFEIRTAENKSVCLMYPVYRNGEQYAKGFYRKPFGAVIHQRRVTGGKTMIKHTLKRTLALLLAVLMITATGVVFVSADGDSSIKTDNSFEAMREILDALTYGEYLKQNANVQAADKAIEIDATKYITDRVDEEGEVLTDAEVKVETYEGIKALYTPASGQVSWEVEVPETAKYSVVLHVYTVQNKATSIERIFRINGSIPFAESRYLSITRNWVNNYKYDENGNIKFDEDIDGNQIRPTMTEAPGWKKYELQDSNGFYSESFEFVLNKGKNVISLEATNEPLAIEKITLVPHESAMSYSDYIAQHKDKPVGSSISRFEAEFPSATSSQTIYPIEDRTDALNSPCDTSRTLLNTLGGSKWQSAGQWVRYKFTVDAAGMYQIIPRFQQNILDGMFTSRALSIKGGTLYPEWTVPFKEASNLRFEYNRNSWQVAPLHFVDEAGETHNVQLYLEPGTYEIEFKVILGDMGELINQVEATLTNINNAYLKIMKLTGSDPDQYRDYGFARVMPDVLRTLVDESEKLYDYASKLNEISAEKSSNIAVLEQIGWLLGRMGRDEEEIAKNLEQMKSYIGTLGTFLSDAKTQPVKFDYIVVQGADQELPRAKANFFEAFAHEMKSFFWSFFRNYNRMGAKEEVDEESSVEVWLAYGRDQSQVIRNLINNDFTPDTGIPVNLKLVTGGTLLPSVLAGRGPDVYIGIGQGDVINYAIRNAILPLEEYEGFEEAIEPFNEAAMMVLGIADANGDYHTYGLPETQQFAMMFVRTDILADLEIDIPQTWDEVLAAVPVLQANNMEIGMSASVNLFLYQMDGELFADGGMRINLDSNVALDAFEKMCNMFTMYSFPYSYDFANRFRTGEMPIGIANYRDTYNHLTVFATELKGRWQFVPLPGIERADGTINNCAVSSTSAIVMMNGCNLPEESWEFIKWHVGAECQIDYSNEMVAILGPSAKHHTANREALESLPWTTTELENVMLQFNNLAAIPNYPGTYIIDRYTKFAFLAAYNDKKNPVEELSSYITTINKEITRKREEFGLETLEIGDTLAKKRVRQMIAEIEKLSAQDQTALNALKNLVKDYNETGVMNVAAVRDAAEKTKFVNDTVYKLAMEAVNAHASY